MDSIDIFLDNHTNKIITNFSKINNDKPDSFTPLGVVPRSSLRLRRQNLLKTLNLKAEIVNNQAA